jgi:hypothetical protein
MIITAEPTSKAEMVALVEFTQEIARGIIHEDLVDSTLDKTVRFLTAGGAA